MYGEDILCGISKGTFKMSLQKFSCQLKIFNIFLLNR